MDLLFFNADALRAHTGPDGRVVIFAFMRAAGIMLSRLLEANVSPGSLKGIIIVSLPFADNISRAGGPDEIAAYQRDHPGESVRVF